MNDWPVGLSTGCFYKHRVLDVLEDIRRAGFWTIEIFSSPTHLDFHDPDAMRKAARLAKELDLDVYSFHAPFAEWIDITSPDNAARGRAAGEILRAAEAAATLEARYFVLHPGPESAVVPEAERLRRMAGAAEVIELAAERCRRLGVGLALENMLPHLFTGHVRELMWLLGAISRTDIGVCLDVGHAALSDDLLTVVRKLSGHLWMVHAHDNNGQRDDHLPPGEGKVDWRALLDQLAEIHFTGTLVLEITEAEDRDRTLERARRGRRFLRDLGQKMETEVRSKW